MISSKEAPVLVGVGQFTNRSKGPGSAGDPIDYMVECAKRAADDAHARSILPKLDSIGVIQVMSRNYRHELKRLSEKLGAHPKDFFYTTTGATIPQILTARLCERISKGQSEIGLICGGEAFHSSAKPDWEKLTAPDYERFPYPLLGDRRDHATTNERRYGLQHLLTARGHLGSTGGNFGESIYKIPDFFVYTPEGSGDHRRSAGDVLPGR